MRILQIVVLGGGMVITGAALAEQPAPDKTCQCSCAEKAPPSAQRTTHVPGRRTDVDPNDIERVSGVDADGVDVQPTPLPPRKLPRDPATPHVFDTPPTESSTPGLPTPTPWRD
jgi:hypothetical protein